MARPRGKIKVVCQNINCKFYRKEEGKDIIKKGKNKSKHQKYFCNHCKKYFVETKGTPLYKKKLSERKIKQLCKEFVEKKGVRAIERTLNINKNTVCNYLREFAEHAVEMTNYFVKNLNLSDVEIDEFWSFVKKNKKKLTKKMEKNISMATSGVLQA